jgi:hypothetical protein
MAQSSALILPPSKWFDEVERARLRSLPIVPPKVIEVPQKKKKKKKKTKQMSYDPEQNRKMVAFAMKLADFERLKSASKSSLPGQDIPFNWSTFFKGTQAPTIRLYLARTDVTQVNNTANSSVLQVSAAQFLNFSDLAAVFDEYRVIGGEILYFQQIIADAHLVTEVAVGVIDYDNATALGSFDAGASHDTKKYFMLRGVTPEKVEASPCRWPMKFEKLPDQDWIDSATTSTVFCSWKIFCNGADVVGTTSVGFLQGWMDFQFRGST